MSVVYERERGYPLARRLDVYAGDALEFTLTAGFALTDVFGEVRRERGDAGPVATFSASIEGEGANVARVILDGEQTAALGTFAGVYDVQALDAAGAPATLVHGSFFCAQDVSRADAEPPAPFDPGYPMRGYALGEDGPMAAPWTELDLFAYVGNDPPTVDLGTVVGEPAAGYAVMGRPDLVPAYLVGVQLASDWLASTSAGVRLVLAVDDDEWLELTYRRNGGVTEIEGIYVSPGPIFATIIPTTTVPTVPPGGLVALHLAGTTMSFLSTDDADPVYLVIGAEYTGAPALGTLTPAFQLISDAGVAMMIAGGPEGD